MSLQNPCVSTDFRKFGWSFVDFICIYFLHKMMKFFIVIFSAWISSTSTKHFFSQKYNRNIIHLLKFIFMDFFWLLGFWQEFHWFYISIFKKLQIIYAFRKNFIWWYYQPPLEDIIFGSWENYLTIWMFIVWESLFFLIINQKVWYSGIYLCFIFS